MNTRYEFSRPESTNIGRKMLKTDMGSQAFEMIYDLMELDKNLMGIGMHNDKKNDPSAVRKLAPNMVESTMDMREKIEDMMVAWLVSVIAQERGENDIDEINRLTNNVLSDRGVIKRAKDSARMKYKYEHGKCA